MAKKTKHSKHNNVSRKRNRNRIRKQTKGSRQDTWFYSWDMSSPRIQPPEPESKPVPVEIVGNDNHRHTRSKHLDE